MPRTGEITLLLKESAGGDAAATDRLFELVYPELQRIATHHMRRVRPERKGLTLEPAVLVHESYLKALGDEPSFENRRHYYAFMTKVMLHVLLDLQRARGAKKRGGGVVHLTLTGAVAGQQTPTMPVSDIARALDQLERLDSRKAEVVKLRFFWGLEMSEIAQLLEVSQSTTERDWRFARTWFAAQLG